MYTIFTFLPIGIALYYSLTNYSGFGAYEFRGLANFAKAFQDKFLWRAFGNTFRHAILTLCLVAPLSFLMALGTLRENKKTKIYRLVYFLPYTLGGAITALVWRFILDPNMGLLNRVLGFFGADTSKLIWLGGDKLYPISFALITLWAMAGFCMLLWSNGLKQIPGEIIEASIIDGASKLQQIFLVILPNLRGTIQTVLILIFTAAMKLFDYVYILTMGGPNHASESIVTYMYTTIFHSRLYGYGSAIALIELVAAVLGSVLIIFLLNKNKEDA